MERNLFPSTIYLRQKLLELKSNNLSWRQIVDEIYPDSKDKSYLRILLYRISTGYNPVSNKLRDLLGLPRGYIVYACPICGILHTAKCSKAAKPPPIGKPRAPRISIRLDDPDSAARSILAHMKAEKIVKLIEILEDRK